MEANIVEAKVLTAKALTLRPTPLLPRGLPPEVLKGINTWYGGVLGRSAIPSLGTDHSGAGLPRRPSVRTQR